MQNYWSLKINGVRNIFIDLKHKLGFKYDEGIINLKKIDGFAIKSGEKSIGLTPVFARQWTEKRCHESGRFHREGVK